MSNGKGSKSRPYSVSQEEFANNWDNIFGKKEYVIPVQETSAGERFIELPDELLKRADMKEGDEVEWTKTKKGFLIKKKA